MLVEKGHSQLSIVKQCELLQISRSGLYYEPVKENAENLCILRWMDEQYLHTPFYGVERLLVLLVALGYKINRKRLRRLMKLQGWQTLYPPPRTTKTDPKAYKYPYLLKEISIERKNQVWAIDSTYVPMKDGFLYLCAVIDVHTRYIVGWGISNTMTAEWCTEIVKEAIAQNGKPAIMNSDQGSQFTSDVYIHLLKENNIQISMDGKGRAIDNIFIERLWRTVNYEHLYLHVYEDGLSLYKGLQHYFSFYNGERRHQSLDYQTPLTLYSRAV
ncbi:MAG: IS3 family transposase [Flavisolibacter sp.]|nr:IS3 family transposase [Flavisolibacter sp.]MBD0331826.1 IS3 family transposase [Chitinophagaceae bacterium]